MAKARKLNILLRAKPTMSVIVGCGVLAAICIGKEVVQAAHRLIYLLIDQDYPSMLVYQYTQFHDRNDAVCFNGNLPYKQYPKGASALVSMGIQVLLLACNTAHAYIGFLKKGIPIIDMIQKMVKDNVSEFLNVSKIGSLSIDVANKEKLYQKASGPHKISVTTLDVSIGRQVMQAIYLIKSGINSKTYLSSNYLDKTSLVNKLPYKKFLAQKGIPNFSQSLPTEVGRSNIMAESRDHFRKKNLIHYQAYGYQHEC